MDGFSYINIFDTKGIEYIVIIIFLLLLIPFWVILNRKKEIATEIRKSYGLLSAKLKSSPHGLYYSKNHTWAFMERSGLATVGLNNLLLHITGKVKINYLKYPGEIVSKGDLIAELQQESRRLKIFSPISGKIFETNDLTGEKPHIVHEDPYEKGWLFAIKPTAWQEDIRDFYLAEEANNWLTMEMERIRDFVSVKNAQHEPEYAYVRLQDGGELVHGLMSELPAELWHDFQQEFLNMK